MRKKHMPQSNIVQENKETISNREKSQNHAM